MERGDFRDGVYEARLRRAADRVQAVLARSGNAWGIPLQITKSITLEADGSALDIHYQLSGLPQDRELHFAVEMNFAGLPAEAEGRYFFDAAGGELGLDGTPLDLQPRGSLGLADEWLGIRLDLQSTQPAGFWTYPIATVSQSEGGFELVHQAVCVLPHWLVRGDADGQWEVALRLTIDTSTAENRMREHEAATSGV